MKPAQRQRRRPIPDEIIDTPDAVATLDSLKEAMRGGRIVNTGGTACRCFAAAKHEHVPNSETTADQ
ncbi:MULTISPECIES: hypothetical protein [Streptomyces]|uniref:Uncharacterized protein n=1 Tax=Streptomyces chartreusis NRRL 3882 TaxID=1079985 RepID=A0A2N9AZR5_STRCX|nr:MULTISPECIES: hypothetical protein [Streptomyces]MYS95635.1 hypothetical protein [Streptomyces sp. SID5464]SOR76557.1 hypothetical protein SCNRRL3882_0041 [Streptomyces chartreusis NRRL 3882]